MMKKLLISVALTLLPYWGFSQSISFREYKINGKVTEESGIPIAYAGVSLFKSQDSVLVTGAVTDDEGEFELTVQPGKYYLKITFLSFQSKIISDVNLTNKDLDLGKLILTENPEMLKEVEVKGQKSQMQLELDKRVFNVGSDITSIGSNAADILNNVPSVAVDMDGTVTLRGSQNVRILVDGKPSGLVGLKSTDALRQLQGDIIDKIEVITNPSARYDAAGEVGIINIILKKNRKSGLNGIFTANAGYPVYLGGSYSINYRKNNLNLFSNYGINYESNPGQGSSYQQYSGTDTSFIYDEQSTHQRSGLSNNFMIGVDYFFNENNTLTASFLYENSREESEGQIEYLDYNENGNLTKTTTRNEIETANENNIEAALSYKKKFAQEDQELTVDFKWMQATEPELADINQFDSENMDTIAQRSGNTENEYNYLIQTDYIHPYGKEGKIETGVKTNLRIVNSEYFFEQQDDNLEWITFPAYANNLIYNEKIYAAYLLTSNKFNKFSFQAGIRSEYSDVTTELTESDSLNNRKYLDFFPSANLSYELIQNHTLQISYSYRINRPNFRDLLPFSGFGDNRNFFLGNPNLNPEYTSSYEFGYLFEKEGISLLSTVYYRHKEGVIQRISEVDSNGIVQYFPINLSVQNAYGMELNLSYEREKWLKFNTSFNFYRAITDGEFAEESLHSDTYSWSNRTSVNLYLGEWNIQTMLNYRGPRTTTQGKDLATYFIDFGVTRDVFKGKGTLALSIRDLLNSRKRRFIIDNEGYYSKNEFQWHARQSLLTFTYRLNQDRNKGEDDEEREENGGDNEF